MKTLKLILLIHALLILCSCASEPKRGFELPIALSEVMRNGNLKGLEDNDTGVLGMPNQFDRVSHVCASQPIYTMNGEYVRTAVHCW